MINFYFDATQLLKLLGIGCEVVARNGGYDPKIEAWMKNLTLLAAFAADPSGALQLVLSVYHFMLL